MNIEISKSHKQDNTRMAVIAGKKTIHFGSSAQSDYTKHKDPERKARYIDRHKEKRKLGKTLVLILLGSCQKMIWHKPTIEASIKDLNQWYKYINFKLKNKTHIMGDERNTVLAPQKYIQYNASLIP